jgi:hypothetical protein
MYACIFPALRVGARKLRGAAPHPRGEMSRTSGKTQAAELSTTAALPAHRQKLGDTSLGTALAESRLTFATARHLTLVTSSAKE